MKNQIDRKKTLKFERKEKMELKIKSIGYKNGTSGWLKNLLLSGDAKIEEGISKSEKHALYLDLPNLKSICIAIFNPFDLSNQELQNSETYQVCINSDSKGFSDAVVSAINAIAQQWCDARNEDRENDDELQLKISISKE